MQFDLLSLVTIGFIILSTSLTVVVLFKILAFKNHGNQEEDKEKEILKEAQTKATHIIHQAIKGAHKIMIRSELAGIKKLADERLKIQDVEEQYREKLDTLTKELTEKLEKNTQKQETVYENFVNGLEKSLQDAVVKSESLFSQKSEEFFKNQSQAFTSISSEIKEQIRSQIEDEMIKTKAAISDYEKSRMRMIDENIASIVEETTLRILGKKLSLKDHTDLILQALEQAKKDGFFERENTVNSPPASA